MKDLNFKDLIAKWKNLPAKTKNLVMVMVGIGVFIIAYMLGFQKLQAATTEVKTEIETQSTYVSELKGYYDNVNVYKSGIETSKADINANLQKLPIGIYTEDFLMYVKTMNEKLGADFQNITFGADNFIDEFGCTVNGVNITAQAMGSNVQFASRMTYAQFKDMLTYIYNDTKEVTFIDQVSLTYDSAELLLDTNVSLNKYYIEYEGAEHTAVPVPNVPTGIADPFGTGSTAD